MWWWFLGHDTKSMSYKRKNTVDCMKMRVLCIKVHWYGLNVCVPSKFTCWNPDPQGDCIRRWGLWDMMRSSRQSPHEWDYCPDYKRDSRDSPHPYCHVRTLQKDSHLCTRKRALTIHWICQHLDLGLPSLQNCEK